MISLDTNVLIRVIVDDPDNQKQNTQARSAVEQYDSFFISQTVQVEVVWVLARAYKLKKDIIINALSDIHDNQAFVLENPDAFEQALSVFKKHNIDFSDSLIYVSSKENSANKILSFDKAFTRLPHVSHP